MGDRSTGIAGKTLDRREVKNSIVNWAQGSNELGHSSRHKSPELKEHLFISLV
jgi:hypothetical protein